MVTDVVEFPDAGAFIVATIAPSKAIVTLRAEGEMKCGRVEPELDGTGQRITIVRGVVGPDWSVCGTLDADRPPHAAKMVHQNSAAAMAALVQMTCTAHRFFGGQAGTLCHPLVQKSQGTAFGPLRDLPHSAQDKKHQV